MNIEIGSACEVTNCPESYGKLPRCAALAVPYVPYQKDAPEKYTQNEALSNGTLFPGLNLPFHLNVEGSTVPNTPLAELQALQFVVLELGTYLDTHQDDSEAFSMFRQYAALEKEARATYEKKYGPLTRTAAAADEKYSWLNEPWPWNYQQNEVQ